MSTDQILACAILVVVVAMSACGVRACHASSVVYEECTRRREPEACEKLKPWM